MPHYVVTYNLVDNEKRAAFVLDFENILTGLGLQKEISNQSTFYGDYHHAPTPQAFVTALFNAVNKLSWNNNDEVTIYYPKVKKAKPNNQPDITKHAFKEEGQNFINKTVFKNS